MRLADFILTNTEPILREWDLFARSIWPEAKASPLLLRDHAEAILRAAAKDMATDQSPREQSQKSRGRADGVTIGKLDSASKEHALGRVRSGFDLMEMVAEYRALRASVVRLWTESSPDPKVHDLTDLTRFNESIDQSLAEAVRSFSEHMDRSREIFLGVLGHDLRNPLNAILLSAQTLAEISEDEAAGLAAQIADSGNAMSRLLTDFLDFTASRLGQGIPVTREPIDLASLCQEVVKECQAGFPRKQLHLLLAGNLQGQWDEGRLRQVLSNLIGNAIQHGSGDEPIEVVAQGAGATVQIRIRNTGAPIPEEALPSLFDPLVQVLPTHPPRVRRVGSMGLGLYIAREVVRAHGGSIEVTSSLREGTVFAVDLPRDTPT